MMIYSKMLAKLILSALTLSLLAACGGGGDSDSSTPSDNNNDDETVIMELSGSVGDGPITGATVTFEGANGNNEDPATSDGNATYQTSLTLSESQFPLIIKATGGLDLVTQGAPDFTLYSVVVDSSQQRISNINPHSTLITRTAQNLAGGINSENLASAQETVLRLFAFGLDPRIVVDPIESQITAANAANISKSSEILGEMIRRTRDTLIATGMSVTGDDVVDAIAADLVDGQLDGLGAAQADKRIAAMVSFTSGQVLLEAAANRLMVNNAVATSAMDQAITATRPSATILTGDVVITAAMLEQIKALANSAASISPLPALSNIINQLASLSGDQQPSEFTRLFPLEVSGAFANIVQQAAQASEADLDEMNRAVNLQTRPDEPGRFEFGAASYSVSESGGVVEITINRVGGNDGVATVEWRTEGRSAVYAEDYNGFQWTTLTFNNGETSKTEAISIVNDDVVESDEAFDVLLGNPTGGASMGTIATTTVTITNDDSDSTPQPGRFEFGAASYSVNENGGSVEITINRLNGSDGAVTIDWQTQDATATSSQDFGGIAQTPLTFADGETSRTETITIINDDVVESNETFNVRLSNPTGGASIGALTTTAVTITNDDSTPVLQPGQFEFSATSYSVIENRGMIEITINRVGGSDGTVSVDWRTQAATATAIQDYGDTGWTTLIFADGETSKTRSISIVDDSQVESDEVFNLMLGNPTGGATFATTTNAAVVIVNDDSNTPVTASQVTVNLSWDNGVYDDNTTMPSGYYIHFGRESGNLAGRIDVGMSTAVALNGTEFNFTGVGVYRFQIVAYNADKSLFSAPSAEVVIDIRQTGAAPEQPAPEQPAPEQPAPEQPAPEQPAPEQPAPEQPAPEQPAPEQPAPEPVTASQVTVNLSWNIGDNTNTTTPPSGYYVYYGKQSGQLSSHIDVGMTTSVAISGTDFNFTEIGEYHFQVVAYNVDKSLFSAPSAEQVIDIRP